MHFCNTSVVDCRQIKTAVLFFQAVKYLMEKRRRVAVVGGTRFQRESLTRQIGTEGDYQVVVSVPAERAAATLVQETCPDLVLVWLDSPIVEAMDVVRGVVEIWPQAEVWLVGDSPSGTYTPLAQRWGASGYLHWQSLEAHVQNLST